MGMTRQADPDKKPELLEKIVDYLLDKPLSALTFRGLATALGVSSFTLVYHFGSRDELVHDIIQAIATRQRAFESVSEVSPLTIDTYCEGLQQAFDLTLRPRNQALQRLEFEAQILEASLSDNALTRSVHQEREERGRSALLELGLLETDAAIESRLILDTFYGIQIGLVISRDTQRASEAFERALTQHRGRILELRGMLATA